MAWEPPEADAHKLTMRISSTCGLIIFQGILGPSVTARRQLSWRNRAATTVNAELLGRDDLGRIGPGAVADLLVLDGDPLRDPSVLWGGPDRRAVFQGGIRVAEQDAGLVLGSGGDL